MLPHASQIRSSRTSRLQFLAIVAVGVVIVDHASKATAVWVDPSSLGFNSNFREIPWFAVIVLILGITTPSVFAATGAGLIVGGAVSNRLSASLFAEGVPDFIVTPGIDRIWNLADAALNLGYTLLALGILIFLTTRLTDRWRLTSIAKRRGAPE